ncbi:hypothetical protein DPMN_145047 [Dreissena polymorpha]|uniref:Uncharacterized protein n=1 Tax=Dreissena polymorpha TaxID=45954 RepID=A0A9D4F379_DREPO|nr:hypothetical protein DPMN_145047 [Dreissena polymorpha]
MREKNGNSWLVDVMVASFGHPPRSWIVFIASVGHLVMVIHESEYEPCLAAGCTTDSFLGINAFFEK